MLSSSVNKCPHNTYFLCLFYVFNLFVEFSEIQMWKSWNTLVQKKNVVMENYCKKFCSFTPILIHHLWGAAKLCFDLEVTVSLVHFRAFGLLDYYLWKWWHLFFEQQHSTREENRNNASISHQRWPLQYHSKPRDTNWTPYTCTVLCVLWLHPGSVNVKTAQHQLTINVSDTHFTYLLLLFLLL